MMMMMETGEQKVRLTGKQVEFKLFSWGWRFTTNQPYTKLSYILLFYLKFLCIKKSPVSLSLSLTWRSGSRGKQASIVRYQLHFTNVLLVFFIHTTHLSSSHVLIPLYIPQGLYAMHTQILFTLSYDPYIKQE